jgi:hypothetical protein
MTDTPQTSATTTTTISDVIVKLDDRIRLMSAVLTATDYPEKSQQRKPHGTHAHARATRKYLNDHLKHPAILTTQTLLDQGSPAEALFTLMFAYQFPEMRPLAALPAWVPAGYGDQLRAFHDATDLPGWWRKERLVWEKALTEVQKVFQKVNFKPLLTPFLGEISEQFVFMPNISYPSDRELGLHYDQHLVCIAPPPLAWGDSPPWPYDEETQLMHSYRVALNQYGKILLLRYLRAHAEKVSEAAQTELPVNDQFRLQYPSWEAQFAELFVTALVAMYLEENVNEAEYKAFVLMEKKVRGMNILPGTVSVMRRYLQERGNKYNTLIEFLPLFPKQLRVAKRIVTL